MKILSRLLILLSCFILWVSVYGFSVQKPEELLEMLKSTGNDQKKIDVLIKLEDIAWKQGDLKKAEEYGRLALLLAEKNHMKIIDQIRINYINTLVELEKYDDAVKICEKVIELSNTEKLQNRKSDYLNLKGYALSMMKQYTDAIEIYTQSAEIQRKLENREQQSFIYTNIGLIYNDLNIHDKALNMFFKALETTKENSIESSQILNMIGVSYNTVKNYEKAMEYYEKGLKIAREHDEKSDIADTLNNLGVIYHEKKDYLRAEQYYADALNIEKELDSKPGICDGLNNLGELKSEMGQLSDAIEYYNMSMDLAEEMEDNWRVSDSLRNIAVIYKKMGSNEKAINTIELSLKKGLPEKSDILLIDIYKDMSDIYSSVGKYEKAFDALKNFKQINDRIVSESSVKTSQELDVKYQVEKTERENQLLKKDKQIQAMINHGLGVAIGCFVLVILLLIRDYRIKVQANRAIQEKNEALQEAKDILDRLSRTDPLTELPNRRDMIEKLHLEQNRYQRSQKPFSVIIADIDHFKEFNDQYGHECGDGVLKSVSEILRNSVRKQDSVCRWGGEEFLFLLPETFKEGAVKLAEKIREKVEENSINYNEHILRATITCGVSEFNNESIESVINLADNAMYQGKKKGRNCVITG